ncbi:hypothetical protein [Actinomyces sp. Z3]|uniref:hypothetical protein n=1 Tax=unclassified Actinomyces TaxID=2609248 RepID=UPI0037C12F6A
MIISLYAGGMTVRDIQHHLASTIGTELSHETINTGHRSDRRGGPGLAAPAAGVSLPGDSGWTRSWSRSATEPTSPTGPHTSP